MSYELTAKFLSLVKTSNSIVPLVGVLDADLAWIGWVN